MLFHWVHEMYQLNDPVTLSEMRVTGQRWGRGGLTHVLDMNQILHHVQEDHTVVRLVQVVHVTWNQSKILNYNVFNKGR